MPTPISDLITAMQEALSAVPPTIIALALIAGPSAAWVLMRGMGVQRSKAAAASTVDMLWVCDACSSVNELRHHRCYRCGTVAPETANLRLIDVGGAAGIVTAAAARPTAPSAPATPHTERGRIAATLAGLRHALIPERQHGPSYRIVATPSAAATAAAAASAGVTATTTKAPNLSPTPRSAGSTAHATTASAAVPVMATSSDRVPVMASSAPAPEPIDAEVHPGLAVGASRPFADDKPVVGAGATVATVGAPTEQLPWLDAPDADPQAPSTVKSAPRRLVTSTPTAPIAPGTPITLPPLPHGALALDTPALKAQREAQRAMARGASRDAASPKGTNGSTRSSSSSTATARKPASSARSTTHDTATG